MVLIKILGILDILSALIFWISSFFHIIPQVLIFSIAIYLGFKGLLFLFSKDIASILDVLAAIIILLSAYTNLPAFVVLLVFAFVLQKGVVSFMF